ncbi:GPH family glycoside/pentoside/hexuronide:cation symporter [Rhodovulum imhoffii]|uniref:GPH family glycoside/pentoside/hexuronide:cation symporter n=1 Tax=Rhodovulum imhoffii TaxID=365340 RepID=A0A2T5BV60_9RHOB|nr:MFS transporter [Rhodovulum imhoffii]MBK5934658.1 sugar:cation symporter [Rhodovulum imhoffii]PTN03367.1 GPH family glycoside/pentoside/hexuronide:cation symporter [Rhodovulum imhoffii]
MGAPLPGYALFAAMLAAAGLPIYIHAPKFYVDEYGVGLGAMGAVLFALRLLDVVQDPALGWLSERLHARRGMAVAGAVAVLAGAMVGLFAVTAPIAPLVWFAAMLTALFSAFSFLNITFYAQGVTRAGKMGAGGHVRLAAWRETGALLGVSAASVAPVALIAMARPFTGFAVGFAGLAVVAALSMRDEWGRSATARAGALSRVLTDSVARRLLAVALVNAMPLAATSTLFLFFVESRLDAPGWEGPLLLLFFLSAAGAAPVWAWRARRSGAKPTLLAGMALSVLAFGFASLLGAGDVAAFALVCVVSGAALGADMTLLPALFASRMAQVSPGAGQGFGLWSFVSKFTLAFAAVILLPLLEAGGFTAGRENPPEALRMLSVLYAVIPCVLKLIAIGLLAATPIRTEDTR